MSGTVIGPSLGSGGRRTGIRAGAVSGPWRGAAKSLPERADHSKLEPVEELIPSSGDLPAPILRLVPAEGVPDPAPQSEVLEIQEIFEPDRGVGPAAQAYFPRQSPVLGAVLLGSAIAIAIVILAFVFRP